jgi:hypothetical protein
MTICHQPSAAYPRQTTFFRTGIRFVTGSKAVTPTRAVTLETSAARALSSLSPVSLLLFFTIHARDKGLEMRCATGASGDTGDIIKGMPVLIPKSQLGAATAWVVAQRIFHAVGNSMKIKTIKQTNKTASNFKNGGFEYDGEIKR